MAETRIVKRYANRKLYDTERSRYVTLEQIAEMIRTGEDVRIVDNASKEDLTSITLTQMQAIEWPALFAETAAIHVDNVRHHGAEYNPHAKLFVAYGLLISGACYLMAQRARAQVRDDLLRALARDVDVLMLPTVGFPVSPVLDDSPGLSIVAEDFSVYTAVFNFTGFPAIQVPCGFDSDGLPVGLQMVAPPRGEAKLLAGAFQKS